MKMFITSAREHLVLAFYIVTVCDQFTKRFALTCSVKYAKLTKLFKQQVKFD